MDKKGLKFITYKEVFQISKREISQKKSEQKIRRNSLEKKQYPYIDLITSLQGPIPFHG